MRTVSVPIDLLQEAVALAVPFTKAESQVLAMLEALLSDGDRKSMADRLQHRRAEVAIRMRPLHPNANIEA